MLDKEVIPDSEEERTGTCTIMTSTTCAADESEEEIIEIFSSDDEQLLPLAKSLPPKAPLTKAGSSATMESDAASLFTSPPRKTKGKYYQTPRSRRVIYSSSSDSEPTPKGKKPGRAVTGSVQKLTKPVIVPNEVIELTDSEDEPCTLGAAAPTRVPPSNPLFASPPKLSQGRTKQASDASDEQREKIWSSDEDDDESIMILNEPKTARKPIRRRPAPPENTTNRSLAPSLQLPKFTQASGTSSPPLFEDPSDQGFTLTGDPSPSDLRGIPSKADYVSTPPARSSKTRTPASRPQGAKRMTKKAQAEAEAARLEAYAEELFAELNRDVFQNKIPQSTKLIWSKRLLTTAGKAKWRRSRTGVDTTEIELAAKILDCDERIRNTLSHEMCHLACWLISNEPKEHHGAIFKSWARRVMKHRPDIEVSTRHNYEIKYPYEWKCENCSKIYGRHSKSIKPEECYCGVCHTGKLIPLFTTRTPRVPQTPRNKSASKNAGLPRDSPQIFTSPTTKALLDDIEDLTRDIDGLQVMSEDDD